MNKDAIKQLVENDGNAPAEPGGDRMRLRPGLAGREPRPGMMRPGMGRPDKGPDQVDTLKNVMLRILVAGNDFDAPIVESLIAGKMPDDGALQHILDEARRIPNLTPAEESVLQTLSQKLSGS